MMKIYSCLFFCLHAFGVSPKRLLNCCTKWLSPPKPVCVQISRNEQFVSFSSSCARFMRRRSKYFAGVSPVNTIT